MARIADGAVAAVLREVLVDQPLSWRQVAAIAEGAPLLLSVTARQRIAEASALVDAIVAKGARAYGVNTGVGALCDVVVEPSQLCQLSRNIVMSHAVGIGAALGRSEVRAILAAAINNYAHGYSGIRTEVVERLALLLVRDCIPEVPAGGSVGYLTHMAHIALVLLGEGHAVLGGKRMSGADANRVLDAQPLVLGPKEGLSLVNGTPCVTGLTALALLRCERLLNWADVISAMSFENLRGQLSAFDAGALSLRASASLMDVGARLRSILADSEILTASSGRRTQDPLSLRAIPQVHGAVRDAFARVVDVTDTELAAVTDNPAVSGGEADPQVLSQANAVGASIGLAADLLAIAVAELAAMAERRIDRLVNPLVSGLPPFLASDRGAGSGFMIAHYTAVALTAENRRLAAPASLDGGVVSGQQEDHLCHATPAALKLLKVIDNAEFVFAIELLAAGQAYDLQTGSAGRAPNTDIVYRALRGRVAHYRDDRPLTVDVERARAMISGATDVDFEAPAVRRSRPPKRSRGAPAASERPWEPD